MRRLRPIIQRASFAITLVLALHLVWILGMSVNESWHLAVHSDAEEADHDCAVVELVHGGFAGHMGTVCAIPQPPWPQPEPFIGVSARTAPALVLSCRIFEHAPPRLG